MNIKGKAILVFSTNERDDSKSPVKKELHRAIKCDVMDTFSDNYYNDRERKKRLSANIRINEYQMLDFEQDDLLYQLTYIILGGRKFIVENVLSDNRMRRKKILDLSETK